MLDVNVNNVLDSYYLIVYNIQSYFSNLIIDSNNSISLILFLGFFLIGVLTILTPCFVSILPVSLSYINFRNDSIFDVFVFIFGILTSLFFFIEFANTFSFYIFYAKLPLLVNSFIFIIGLDLINILNFSEFIFFFTSLIKIPKSKGLLFKNYLVGVFIGCSSLPCNTSIFFIIIFLVKNTHSFLFLYAFAYILGLIMPLLLIFSFKPSDININPIASFSSLAYYFSGSFLIVLSLFSILCNVFI